MIYEVDRGSVDGWEFSNNVFCNHDRRGLYARILDSGAIIARDWIIKNNLFFNNGLDEVSDYAGVYLRGAFDNAQILFNTFDTNTGHGINLQDNASYAAEGTKSVLKYNLFTNNGGYGVFFERSFDPAGEMDWDYNLYDNNAAGNWFDNGAMTGPNAILDEDPLFTGSSGLDGYHLSQVASGQVGDSPAVNAADATALALGMVVYANRSLTTRSDGQPDEGSADLGYHYFGASAFTRVPNGIWSRY